jgi:5-methylcytosine-specific restriction protein B
LARSHACRSNTVGQTHTYNSHADTEKRGECKKYKYFQQVKPGDKIVGYVCFPRKQVVAILEITKGLHQSGKDESIEFAKVEQLAKPIDRATLEAAPGLAQCEPLKYKAQGSLMKLTPQEYKIILSFR